MARNTFNQAIPKQDIGYFSEQRASSYAQDFLEDTVDSSETLLEAIIELGAVLLEFFLIALYMRFSKVFSCIKAVEPKQLVNL